MDYLDRTLVVDAVPQRPLDVLLSTSILLQDEGLTGLSSSASTARRCCQIEQVPLSVGSSALGLVKSFWLQRRLSVQHGFDFEAVAF